MNNNTSVSVVLSSFASRYKWVFGPWSNCSCAKKYSWRARRCVMFFPNSTQTYVSEKFCDTRTPVTKQLCDKTLCPVWHVGHWAPVPFIFTIWIFRILSYFSVYMWLAFFVILMKNIILWWINLIKTSCFGVFFVSVLCNLWKRCPEKGCRLPTLRKRVLRPKIQTDNASILQHVSLMLCSEWYESKFRHIV